MIKEVSKKRSIRLLIDSLKKNPDYSSLRYKDQISFIRKIILLSVKKSVIKEIYIFGSYANGDANGDSDIDICVILNNHQDRSNISLKIRTELIKNNILWCDLLVYNENIFYNAKNKEGIENTILNEGILIYG